MSDSTQEDPFRHQQLKRRREFIDTKIISQPIAYDKHFKQVDFNPTE